MMKSNIVKRVTEQLISNLPKLSIIVMDNPHYHSVVCNKVTSALKVDDIKLSFSENNIPFEATAKKPNLLMLVK